MMVVWIGLNLVISVLGMIVSMGIYKRRYPTAKMEEDSNLQYPDTPSKKSRAKGIALRHARQRPILNFTPGGANFVP
jgi:hypothetical protein